MIEFLQKVLEDSSFINRNNEKIVFHSHTGKAQCEFLQKIISENNFKKSVEVGFAYGLSTLAILESIKNNGGSKHVVIDVFENKYWGGNGLDLVHQSGLSSYLDFREDFCYKVLPQLLLENRKFDFAYIDSTKQFDWIFCNFFIIDKMLEKNGIIVFDDVSWPGIRKVMRFINQLPNYKVYDIFPDNKKIWLREVVSKLIRIIPGNSKLFSPELINTDYQQNISTHCVAFIKKEEDSRKWDWHKPF